MRTQDTAPALLKLMGNSDFPVYLSFLVCVFDRDGRDGEDSREDRDSGEAGEGRDDEEWEK